MRLPMLAVAAACGSLLLGSAWSAPSVLTPKSGPEVWVVPPGVTSINVTVKGGQGRSVDGNGGKGAVVTATMSVYPGEILMIRVGSRGDIAGGGGGLINGGLGGGGAASEIRRNPSPPVYFTCAFDFNCDATTRVVVAAGGGGSGKALGLPGATRPHGGAGGCITGGAGAGTAINSAGGDAAGGGAATSSAHGTAGAGTYAASFLMPGPGGVGFAPDAPSDAELRAGNGAVTIDGNESGGGGSGYKSGGGGGLSHTVANGFRGVGGGGGGSSYVSNNRVVLNSCTPGANEGDGEVIISVEGSPYVTTFGVTNSEQFYRAPFGAESLATALFGASGNYYPGPTNAFQKGSTGGIVKVPLPVTSMEVIQVNVGGRGWGANVYCARGFCPVPYQGGWNGGGWVTGSPPLDKGYSGGGGATDIRRCPNANVPPHCPLSSRVAVAAGGGGTGRDYDGGIHGPGSGLSATAPFPNESDGADAGVTVGSCSPACATGGTMTSGGVRGPPTSTLAQDGGFGYGGNTTAGGAGGGGWYGGGAGEGIRAGGGGSNYFSITGLPGGTNYWALYANWGTDWDRYQLNLNVAGDGIAAIAPLPLAKTGPLGAFTQTVNTFSAPVLASKFSTFDMRGAAYVFLHTSRSVVSAFEAEIYSTPFNNLPPWGINGVATRTSGGGGKAFLADGGASAFVSREPVEKTIQLSALLPSTTYYYKACALTASGGTCGTIVRFVTPALDAPIFVNWTAPMYAVLNVAYPPYAYKAEAVSPVTSYAIAGTLPPGMTFTAGLPTSTLGGTPTVMGVFKDIQVSAANINGTSVVPVNTTIIVLDGTVTWAAYQPPANAAGGVFFGPYTYNATTNPSSPLEYRVMSGALPPGLVLDRTTGVLGGTPTQEGVYTFRVIAEIASLAVQAPSANTITVVIPPTTSGPPIFSVTQAAPTGTVGTTYAGGLFTAYDLPVTNTLVLFLAEGSLPSGLRFNATSGVISGTPRAAGRFRFRIGARNDVGSTLANVTEITIAAPVAAPSPVPSVSPLAAAEPRLKIDISLIGGDENDLKQGSGELLREALIALGNNTSLEPVYTRLSVANLTTPVSALTSLGNRTSAVNGTLGPSRVLDVPRDDPFLNRPIASGSNGRARRLAGGCQPVTLSSSSSGVVTVPTTNASLSLSLNSAFYTQNNAVTTEQKTALLAVVQQQFALAFSSNSSVLTTNPQVQEFVNAFAACTGLPPALGVVAGFSNPVISFGEVSATTSSAAMPSSDAGAIAGGIIGGLAGLFLLGLLVYFIMTSRHCCCATGILVVAERHQCFTNFKFDVSPDFYFGPKTPITVEACEHSTLGEVVRGVVSRVGPYGDVKKCGAIIAGPDSNGQRTAITGRIFSVADSGDKELGALGFTRDNGAANTTHSLVGLTSKPVVIAPGGVASTLPVSGSSPVAYRG